MEAEIDIENRNPKIESKNLLQYKLILPEKPARKPSRKEVRDAVKCRRSGMVPGAIRKYLIQKKQHEEEGDEEGANGELSRSISPSSSTSSSSNNLNYVEAEIVTDDIRRNEEEEQDDDEIHIVGEYTQPESEVLSELSQNSKDNNRTEQDSDFESDTDFEDHADKDETVRDSPVHGLNNKRRYIDAFNSDHPEPDSTTTIDSLRVSPEKQSKLEKTPSRWNEPDRNARNGHRDRSPTPGPSGARGGDDGDEDAVVIRNNRGLIIGSHVRNIFPPNVQTKSAPFVLIDSENSKLDNLIRKNNWKMVIGELRRNLEDHKLPSSEHLGDFVKKAILSLGTRVSKEIPAQAIEFFKQLVTEYPIRTSKDESLEYYIKAFNHTSGDSNPAEFFVTVLNTIEVEAKSKVTPKALPFFKSLTKMAVNQYKEYLQTKLRLRRPFFVRFLEDDPQKVMSYNIYCEKLLQYMFSLKDYPDECKALMRWVGLLALHLRRSTHLDMHFNTLVVDFVKSVSKPEFLTSRIPLIQSISEKLLGAAVCLQLIRKIVKFELIDGHDTPTDDDAIVFLNTISKSELIVGLKSGLKERRRFDDVCSIGLPKIKKLKTDGVNMKGESHLHRLCRKASGATKNDYGLKLEKFLREKRFPINPRDNFGNTPLHDAVAHERFDALTKFHDYCSDPSLPEDLQVDIRAQNDAGETPFHLAATTSDCDIIVEVLRLISDNLQVTDEAIKLLNHEGKMPYQLAYTPQARSLLNPGNIKELPYEVGNVRVSNSSRTELQSIDCKRLIALWSEFNSD